MTAMTLTEFSEWVDHYRPQLTQAQFKNEALRQLAPYLGALDERGLNTLHARLEGLHRAKHIQAEFEPALVALLRPASSNAVEVRAYRGEHGEGAPLQTKLGCLSFGSKEVALTYAMSPNDRRMLAKEPKIIEAVLRLNNPIKLEDGDPFIDGQTLVDIVGVERTWSIMAALEDHLNNTDNFGELKEEHGLDSHATLAELREIVGDALLPQLYVDAYPVFDEPEYVGWFIEKGFDGVVHGGNGESAMELEYKVFDPNQVQILSVTPAEWDMFDTPEINEVDVEVDRPRLGR